MSSEIYTYLFEKLLENGALDVFATPIFMKKNRPAYMLSVICTKKHSEEIINIIFSETTTFGLRFHYADRKILDRDFEKVNTKYGEITIKNGYLNNEKIKTSLEFETLKQVAKDNNISIQKIVNEVYKNL